MGSPWGPWPGIGAVGPPGPQGPPGPAGPGFTGDPDCIVLTNDAGALQTLLTQFTRYSNIDSTNGNQAAIGIGSAIADLIAAVGNVGGLPGSILLLRARNGSHTPPTGSFSYLYFDGDENGVDPNFGTGEQGLYWTVNGGHNVGPSKLVVHRYAGDPAAGNPRHMVISLMPDSSSAVDVLNGGAKVWGPLFVSDSYEPPAAAAPPTAAQWSPFIALESYNPGNPPPASPAPSGGGDRGAVYLRFNRVLGYIEMELPGTASWLPMAPPVGLGTAIASITSNAITLPGNSDYAHLTAGTGTIKFITKTNTYNGQEFTVNCDNLQHLTNSSAGAPGTALPLRLSGNADKDISAGSVICVRRDDTLGAWREMYTTP